VILSHVHANVGDFVNVLKNRGTYLWVLTSITLLFYEKLLLNYTNAVQTGTIIPEYIIEILWYTLTIRRTLLGGMI